MISFRHPTGVFHFVSLFLLCCASRQAVAAGNAPVPSAARQKETAAVLEEVYRLSDATTLPKKRDVIPKLLGVAKDAVGTQDFDQLHGILLALFDLSRDTQDMDVFLASMKMLTDYYAVDPGGEWKVRFNRFLAKCESGTEFGVVVRAILPVVLQFSRDNQHVVAWELLAAAESCRLRIAKPPENAKQAIADAKRVVRERESAFKLQADAATKLAVDAEDPQANYILGAWLAAFENDWTQALPKLTKGSKDNWKQAAQAELQVSADADAQAKVANRWWDLANEINGESVTKDALRQHAHQYYSRVVARISDPLLKSVVERRMEESQNSDRWANGMQSSAADKDSTSSRRAFNSTAEELPVGESVNLLSMIQLPDHAVEGSWRLSDGALVCGSSLEARVMAPVALLRNYELRLEFVRQTGSESICLVCPLVGTTFTIQLGAYGGKYAGLLLIDGKNLPDIKDRQAVISPATLENGKSYTLQVTVQESRGVATISANLNGQQFVHWRGACTRLSTIEGHQMPSLRSPGVLVHVSTATIKTFEARLSRGGVGYRLANDWKNPLDVVANHPPKSMSRELAPGIVRWNGRNYLVASKPTGYSDAQRLAMAIQGRLVTISSQEESNFIHQLAKGRRFWTSGWRPVGSNQWRDERNRPLRLLTWNRGEPNNLHGRELRIVTYGEESQWNDTPPWTQAYACIEWGEEYPAE